MLMMASQLPMHPSCLLGENGSGPFKFPPVQLARQASPAEGAVRPTRQGRPPLPAAMCSQAPAACGGR